MWFIDKDPLFIILVLAEEINTSEEQLLFKTQTDSRTCMI
jgi:hypothetical protein